MNVKNPAWLASFLAQCFKAAVSQQGKWLDFKKAELFCGVLSTHPVLVGLTLYRSQNFSGSYAVPPLDCFLTLCLTFTFYVLQINFRRKSLATNPFSLLFLPSLLQCKRITSMEIYGKYHSH